MSGAGSTSARETARGTGDKRGAGLRLRPLTERSTAGAEPPEPRRARLRRRCERLAATAWSTLRPTRNRSTGYVAMGAVAALVGTSVVVGVGAASSLPHLADIGAWLPSAKKGEAAHVNGLTGAVDGKVTLPGTAGKPVQISQDGKSVLVLDPATGRVVRIDPAQLTAEQSSDYGTAGLELVAGGPVAYLVDPVRGTAQRIDPVRTTPIGAPVGFGGRLGAPAVDPQGTLWVPVPGRGEVVPVVGGRKDPAVSAGRPGDTLVLTLADGRPVVTDTTAARLEVLSPTGVQATFNLPGGIGGSDAAAVLVPDAVDGSQVPVLDSGSGALAVVDVAAGQQSGIRVPVEGHRLGSPQVLGHRVYIPDETTGSLLVYDLAASAFDNAIRVTGTPGTLQLFVHGGLLWANDQDNAAAAVVGADGQVHPIGKYATDVPTARRPQETPPVVVPPHVPVAAAPPPTPTRPATHGPAHPTHPPSPTPTTPATPTSTGPDCKLNWQAGCPQPMAPGTPQVQSGNGTITVTFAAASGTTPSSYTLTGAPAGATTTPSSVGPGGPFTFQVSGGSCGSQYTFTVVAHYTGGAGDKASQPSAPARPCTAPGAPAVHVSVPQGGHGGTVSWSAVPGATSYRVAGPGGTVTVSGRSHTYSGLRNSSSYSVTVTALNAAGSASAGATIDLTPPAKTLYVTGNSPKYGDLYIHTSPYATTANRDGSVPAGQNGTAFTVYCQTPGSAATNDVNGAHSSIWDRIAYKGVSYVSDLWISTTNHNSGQYSPQDVWQCT